jgi:predicted metalloprotease with PDZ domain
VAALAAYQPYDWDAYFKSRVYAVTAHPPSPFEALGWKLVYTATPNSAEAARAKIRHSLDAAFSLGIAGNDKGVVSDVLTGSPAAKAGLGISDTIVAVDNREYSSDVLSDGIKAAQGSSAPIVLIVKRNGIYRTVSIDYHDGPRYPHLVRIDGTPDRLAGIVAPHRP